MLRTQQICRELLAHDTGQPLARIAADFDRDRFMTAAEAKAYGIIDAIVGYESDPNQCVREACDA